MNPNTPSIKLLENDDQHEFTPIVKFRTSVTEPCPGGTVTTNRSFDVSMAKNGSPALVASHAAMMPNNPDTLTVTLDMKEIRNQISDARAVIESANATEGQKVSAKDRLDTLTEFANFAKAFKEEVTTNEPE